MGRTLPFKKLGPKIADKNGSKNQEMSKKFSQK